MAQLNGMAFVIALVIGLLGFVWLREIYWRDKVLHEVDKACMRVLAERHAADARQALQIGENQRAFYDMKEEVDKIAFYLRDNYEWEISQGYHSGRPVSAVVIGYLARERAQHAAASQARSQNAETTTARINTGA